ncbi:MAG: hypothetical protein F4038_07500 [Chloroflexi bacterium]|nr:hypothetical protein [Chloroflexota bacterium]MYJ92876.1 hypothetical protein [Chloroflexota bacterium]
MIESVDEAETNLIRAKLQDFFTRNPEADLRREPRGTSVINPWGERDLEIPVASDNAGLLEALNALRLAPRFTAIWHEDKSDLEIIYTVLSKDDPLLRRKFEFRYSGDPYECSFELSSRRLRLLASEARDTSTKGPPSFRNLLPFHHFEHTLRADPDSTFTLNGTPTSFWIRGLESFNEDFVAEMVRNLNFHMSHFDRNTPRVIVHEEKMDVDSPDQHSPPQVEYFPEILTGREIDQHLLILWESAHSGDPFLRFIQYYQILEYAGFYYLQAEVRRAVERAISVPDAASRPERVTQRVLDAMSAQTLQGNQQINAMIAECVDPAEMLEMLEASIDAFSHDLTFDGGFTLKAILPESVTYEDFKRVWNGEFPRALHNLRNALVHARESRQTTMIAPTRANQVKLNPWLLPLAETAGRVMLYSGK